MSYFHHDDVTSSLFFLERLRTFHSLLVEELGETDRDVGVGQVWVPLPLNGLAQWPTVVQQEAFIGEINRQRHDEGQEKDDKEEPEEEAWRQDVPLDPMDLGDGGVVVQPLVGQADHTFESSPETDLRWWKPDLPTTKIVQYWDKLLSTQDDLLPGLKTFIGRNESPLVRGNSMALWECWRAT